MALKNKGLWVLSVIIAIFILTAGVVGVYIVKNIDKQDVPENIGVEFGANDSEDSQLTKIESDDIASLGEENQEIFKGQPGHIKSIVKKIENLWVLDVDFVTKNPNWHLYGTEDYSPDEPFYLNQNSKIRSFNVTDKTKLKWCSLEEGARVDIEAFMREAQEYIAKNIKPGYLFDTNGSEAVSIMKVCVP